MRGALYRISEAEKAVPDVALTNYYNTSQFQSRNATSYQPQQASLDRDWRGRTDNRDRSRSREFRTTPQWKSREYDNDKYRGGNKLNNSYRSDSRDRNRDEDLPGGRIGTLTGRNTLVIRVIANPRDSSRDRRDSSQDRRGSRDRRDNSRDSRDNRDKYRDMSKDKNTSR